MQKYPDIKRYLYTIPTIRWDLTFDIKQYFAKDSLDIYEMYKTIIESKDINTKSYFIDKKNTVFKQILSENIVPIANKITQRRRLNLIYKNIHEYEISLLKMLHTVRESAYEWKNIAKPKWYRKSVFIGWDIHIYKETWIPIDEINNRLTLEQKGWWSDKLLFDYYETFDEGKKVNSSIRSDQWLSEQEQKLLDYMTNNGTWN